MAHKKFRTTILPLYWLISWVFPCKSRNASLAERRSAEPPVLPIQEQQNDCKNAMCRLFCITHLHKHRSE